jgi:hypothetical protein
MTDGPSHPEFEERLTELAVGILDGRERVSLLGHVDSCASCSAELEQMTATVDGLVHLAVPVDPPVGFETRLFDQLQMPVPTRASGRQPRRGRRRQALAAAAAALLVAFGIGWGLHPTAGRHGSQDVSAPSDHGYRTADLVSGSRQLGEASVYGHGPQWLFMAVEGASRAGPVNCTVTTTDGRSRVVGSFELTAGRGTWVAPLRIGTNRVASAELLEPGGRVLAVARFG